MSELDRAGASLNAISLSLSLFQRGSNKLRLTDLGLKMREGEERGCHLWPPRGGRSACGHLFRSTSNIVLMTDSAVVYTSSPWPVGTDGALHVNHSQKPQPELSRSVDVLGNVKSLQRRVAVCSTNTVDPTWRELKDEIPRRGNVSAKTARQRQAMGDSMFAQANGTS